MQLQSNVRVLPNEELEMHTVSAWKEGKLQIYGRSAGPLILRRRPLISVGFCFSRTVSILVIFGCCLGISSTDCLLFIIS